MRTMVRRSTWAAAMLFTFALSTQGALRDGLIFHAGFNQSVDADFATGDAKLYWAPEMKFPPGSKEGLPPSDIIFAKGQGKFGDCLHFQKKTPAMVFFKAKGNAGYSTTNWNGTVSFWLRLTPDEDLEPGFADPIQITSKAWNNAAFFVEFSKDEKPREFRLGAYADFPVWNPENKEWNSIPMSEKPLVPVVRPPFSRERWTHVAFTFENFNTGKLNGVARLYLNGKPRGELTSRTQTFTWDIEKAMIMLGLSYIGYFDELSIFSRSLSETEIDELAALDSPLVSK